ncbi:carboxypeptidase-like regulatory domain-containing protein [Flavobacterium sp. UBA7680]|uniref:carboxypeptidase-like regulatory domain-containing protein n=1 Tax=Flavobacterium sp. UBA7680 TaxID=1946559 RepID=UPI0025C69528|nr:carboxypeptidase-like regulatory domain-containing protein [Flavobacterium sp. UBA7680]
MKKLLLFLLLPIIGFSQTIYKGNVSNNNEPIPGARICILNTSRCTTSDFYGNYSIEVKIGDELQISFIGLKTKTIKITNSTFKNNEGSVAPIYTDDYIQKIKKPIDSAGISNPSGYFEFNLGNNLENQGVMKITRHDNGFYGLKNSSQYHKLSFEVNQEYAFSTPIRLPKYQKIYAQGRSQNGELAYQSPETNEIFSWGPNINSLTYSGNATEYYPSGNIVNKTSANQNSLQLYNPNNFFRNSEDNKISFTAQVESPKGNYLKVNFGYKTGNLSIPESRNNEITTSLKYFRNVSDKSKIETLLSYNDFENNLSNFNFGINKIIYANAVTPIHFDNKYTSTLSNGMQRSYSALENNPYYLIQNNADENKSKTLSFNFNHIYADSPNQNSINVGFQSSEIINTNGQNFYFASVNTPNFDKRTENFKSYSFSDVYRYKFDYGHFIESKVDFRFQQRKLDRNYFSGFSSPADFPNNGTIQNQLNFSQERFEVLYNINGSYTIDDLFDYDQDLILKANSSLNYSSTVKNDILPNYFVSAEFRNLFDSPLVFAVSHGYNEVEPSLQNNNLNFNSLLYSTNQFKELKNSLELITPNNAIATQEGTTNLELNYASYNWYFNLSYYHKKVENLYAPIFNSNAVSWSPNVNYKQNGVELEIQKLRYYRLSFSHSFNLNFTYYKNEVTSLNNNQSRIPFAGFTDISKNYIVGQPLGVIAGSSYLRDANDNIIIDNEGFPIKNAQPKILGNPNPDFVVGFYNCFNYKNFELSLTLDWSQGGKIWNGTQQTLNYYGKSEITGKERNVTNYVFKGVTQSGSINTKAVSFYDPVFPVEQNRWTRYGTDGIAEDAMEDATYLRLSSVNLSYSRGLKKISFKISLFVNNAFIASKSKTAFSNNAMFNSIDTSGLDYFNSPMMRSFGSSLMIKF